MKKVLLLIVAVLMAGAVEAQTDNTMVKRAKVGVVLSGGGAKGMAHIGVLKVLEKAGIPIDIITGTSMGSIIGGLYSIGYNANALDSVARAQDWSYVISDKEDLRNQSLRDRLRQYTYVFTTGLSIGKRNRSAGGGLIKGKNLAELFQHLCTGYTDSLDFSKDLPIPFACVATDIIDNSEVDFHSGRLAQAMRSSMSIPGAFAPVRMGERVLVDGGLKNNYPADIAKEMGADIIIGVTVQGAPKGAEEMGGTMSIISQIVDVNCKNKLEDNLAITDLHMQVDTKGYGSASFSAAAIDTLIRRGEEEAMRHWDEIVALKQRIGIDDSFRPTIHHPLRPQAMTEKLPVTSYTFENMNPQTEMFLRQKFHLRKNDSIDAKLAQEITTCMRTDLFYQTAECQFVPDGDGVRVIISAGNRKSVQLHAGMRYDSEEHASLQVNAEIPLKTPTPINSDITLRLGKRMMVHGDLTFHPLSFTRPTISYSFRRNDVDVYVNGDHDYSILYHHHQAELLPFNFDVRHFNFQIGLRWDYVKYRDILMSEKRVADLTLDNKHYFSYRARADYNSEDNWNFPTRGARFKAEYAYLTDNFLRLDGQTGLNEISANWRMSFTLGKRFTLQPMLYGRLLLGDVVTHIFGNIIGGSWFGHYIDQQMPFAGVGNMEYVGNQFVASQLQGQYRIGSNHYVLVRFAAGLQSNKLKEIVDHRMLLGGQIAYYYNTIFGPLGATLGYSNHTKEPYFFLDLGYEF